MEIRDTSCCGLRELAGISDCDNPTQVIEEIYGYFGEFNLPPAFFLFTGVVAEKYGQNLAEFIKTNKLGRVVESPSVTNLNSGNRIRAWIWTVSRTGIDRMGREMKWTR